MEKFIISAGTALWITDSGKGDHTLVLLHGYLESLEVWDSFAKLFPGYRIISLDLPGHGISQVTGEIHTMEFLADVINGVLEKLGIDRCFICGHSMGGYAALAFAAKYPQKLQGLILFHSTPNADTEEKKTNRQREIEIVKAGKKELLAKNISNSFANDNIRHFSRIIQDMQDQLYITDDEGIIALLNGMCTRADSNGMLKELKIPQLFIFGKKDNFISQEASAEIIAAHPQAKAAWLENSGHMGFVEEADRSAEIIREFIEKHT